MDTGSSVPLYSVAPYVAQKAPDFQSENCGDQAPLSHRSSGGLMTGPQASGLSRLERGDSRRELYKPLLAGRNIPLSHSRNTGA